MSATFLSAPEVEQIAREVIQSTIEHDHLREARILYLFREGTWANKGKTTLGTAKRPTAIEGFLASAPAGEQYQFIITINRGAWGLLTPAQRKALVDHELCHCSRKEGQWITVGHDTEEFASVIRRHGLWEEGVRAVGEAVNQLTIDSLDLSAGPRREDEVRQVS